MIACIVLPTYNEAENISLIIPEIFKQQQRIKSHDLHVLVVDDNSPDGTRYVVEDLMSNYPDLHLITGPKKGLGKAYKRGMAWAIDNIKPDLIFEMDADLQHDPDLIPLFIMLTGYGFSLVIGSRFAPGGSTPDFSFRRRLISRIGNWMVRFLGGIPRITDCTSGYRCIKAELIRKCDLSYLSTRGYSFQSSFLCELIRNGARVVVNMGFYTAFTRLFGIPMEVASPVAIEMSILTNFFMIYLWLKHSPYGSLAKKLVRFHMLRSVGAITNYAILLVLAKIFGLWDIAANLIGIAVGIMINYGIISFLTSKIHPSKKT